MNNQHTRRLIRAYLRDTWILIKQFRLTLLVFLFLLLLGTLILHFAYGDGLSFSVALHTAFKLMFFETLLDYPDEVLAQFVFLVWPVLGLFLVVNGVVSFGTALFSRQERKEAWQVAVASTYRNHIVVCGLGRVGYRVSTQLLKMGQEFVGIEQDEDGIFLDELREQGVTVLIGDVRNREMLERAGVPEASAVVACTQDDLTNLEVALESREMNPGIKVVMRMFDQRLAERVRRGFDINTAFSTSQLAAPALAAASTRAAVDYSFYVKDILLNVSQVTIVSGSPFVGEALGDLEEALDISTILHCSGDAMNFHPAPELILRDGDQIVVFATLESLAHLNQMNRGEHYAAERRGPRAWLDRWRQRRQKG